MAEAAAVPVWAVVPEEDNDKKGRRGIMMRRRISVFLLLVILACSLTGCVTEKTREDIISCLEKEGIIEDDWAFEELIVHDASPIPDISSYNYIYTDDDEVYAVCIQGKNSDEEYPVFIMEDVEIEESEWVRDDGETVIDKNVVDFEITESYTLKYEQFLWFKYMVITK